jgi:SAM-dependent methyltransferase
VIATQAPPPARLFEIGAGAGAFLDAARQRGYVVRGVEFSPEAARFARERLELDVRQGRAEELVMDEGWDVVTAFETVEHLLDPRRVLEGVRRLLVDDGVLIVSVPNLDALSRTFLGSDWAVLSPAEHLSYFTENTLGRLLRDLGYVDVRFERRHGGFSLAETMNAACTHRPGGWRQIAYRVFIRLLGRRALPVVQATGRGDTLLCLARSPSRVRASRLLRGQNRPEGWGCCG